MNVKNKNVKTTYSNKMEENQCRWLKKEERPKEMLLING